MITVNGRDDVDAARNGAFGDVAVGGNDVAGSLGCDRS